MTCASGRAYSYDQKNRLTNLSVNGAAPIASYAYTLDNTGHRTSKRNGRGTISSQ